MTATYADKEPHLLETWSEMSPLGRLGRPDELRGVVTWLASDASSFCTGSECVFRLLRCLFFLTLSLQYFGEWRISCVVEVTCRTTVYECRDPAGTLLGTVSSSNIHLSHPSTQS